MNEREGRLQQFHSLGGFAFGSWRASPFNNSRPAFFFVDAQTSPVHEPRCTLSPTLGRMRIMDQRRP